MPVVSNRQKVHFKDYKQYILIEILKPASFSKKFSFFVMSKHPSIISDTELSQLKEEVLKAIVNNRPVPGSTSPLTFPDLNFVLSQPDVYLRDIDVKSAVRIEKLNKSIQILSEERLKQIADNIGKVIYLQFQTAELEKDNLMLSLEAKVLSPAPNYRKMNLSNMQMNFRKVGKDWKMIGHPTSLSS